MGVTVARVDALLVHKGSGGVATVYPDVCKTPAPPAPLIPLAYPSTAPPLPAGAGVKTGALKSVAAVGSTVWRSSGGEAGNLKDLPKTGAGVSLMNQLKTLGFTAGGARLMVQGLPVTTPQDQILLYARLRRSNLTVSNTTTRVKIE